ncbi:MAG: hypothetical protein GX585_05950 [Clostridiales bacterium]|nr:hypothetical protein [Clostridiales bacterium]
MNQNKLILDALKEGKEVTPQFAMREFGVMRLGSRIYDLRRMGHPIATEMKEGTNRYGRKIQFASYKLMEA